MSIGEALALVEILSGDPSSHLFAAIAEWKYPVSHEFLVLADLFDAFAKVNFKKPDPYPRPKPDSSKAVERLGERIAPPDIAAVLRGFGREVPQELLPAPPTPE